MVGVLRLKKGVPEMPEEGAQRSAQYSGFLDCETRSGCWSKSRPMAERIVGGTLMDTALDKRAASPVPGL